MGTDTKVTLIRPVPESCLRWKAGPWVGMAALQKYFRANCPDWLTIAKRPVDDSIPWFWCWMDTPQLRMWASQRKPFVVGPNLYPEKAMRSPLCLLSIAHSAHHRDWLQRKSGSSPPSLLVPYPVTPIPAGPNPIEHDVLVYAKKRSVAGVMPAISREWPRVKQMRYGHHSRSEIFRAAAESNCVLYWSKWDTGSILQAETMLAGAPNVGSRLGSPWIIDGVTGRLLTSWQPEDVVAAIRDALCISRESVRDHAIAKFCAERIGREILDAIDNARKACNVT